MLIDGIASFIDSIFTCCYSIITFTNQVINLILDTPFLLIVLAIMVFGYIIKVLGLLQ